MGLGEPGPDPSFGTSYLCKVKGPSRTSLHLPARWGQSLLFSQGVPWGGTSGRAAGPQPGKLSCCFLVANSLRARV